MSVEVPYPYKYLYCCVRNYSAWLHSYVETSVNIVIQKYCRVSTETCNNIYIHIHTHRYISNRTGKQSLENYLLKRTLFLNKITLLQKKYIVPLFKRYEI
jgi:hypothetical protein